MYSRCTSHSLEGPSNHVQTLPTLRTRSRPEIPVHAGGLMDEPRRRKLNGDCNLHSMRNCLVPYILIEFFPKITAPHRDGLRGVINQAISNSHMNACRKHACSTLFSHLLRQLYPIGEKPTRVYRPEVLYRLAGRLLLWEAGNRHPCETSLRNGHP